MSLPSIIVQPTCCDFAFASLRARDHDFDAAVLGAPVRRRIGGDGDVRALAVDLDRGPGCVRPALEQLGDRLGALDREIPVRREAHALDRHVLSVCPTTLIWPGSFVEQRAMRAATA